MTTTGVTARQREVLEFIRDFTRKSGWPPTLREISARFGMSGTRAAEKHVVALARKGLLARGRGARTLRVLDAATRAGRGRRGAGSPSVTTVPIVGQVAAGRPILAEENLLGALALDPAVLPGKGAFLLRVAGDSMRGAGILDGDLAIVRPQPDAASGDIVVALVEGEATVKRLRRRRDEAVLEPENPEFRPIRVRDAESLRIVGKVTGVLRF